MVDRFRNLQSVDLELSPGFNVFSGINGSGKTSVLEAIHVLSVGRSFRTQKIDPLVCHSEKDFLIFADLADEGKLGLLKARNGRKELKYSGQIQKSWQDVAAALPLQILNSESFLLLEGGGRVRRRFLDWAVFHVEHSYLRDWRAYRRGIAHRNSLLKSSQQVASLEAQLDAWDLELAILGESIHRRRAAVVEAFSLILAELIALFLPARDISLEYKAGWDSSMPFSQALREQRGRDLSYGMTTQGPHRGDFQVRLGRQLATELLSRGQLKMLVCALKIAMGQFLHVQANARQDRSEGRRCIYLIDDLASELDQGNRARVMAILAEQGAQCLLTAVEADDLSLPAEVSERSGKFHVEHGKIRAY